MKLRVWIIVTGSDNLYKKASRSVFEKVLKRVDCLDAEKFVTKDMPLENLVEAMELMRQQKVIKYNITT